YSGQPAIPLAQTHLAWQAITDRQLTNLTPSLRALASNGNIPALWALEGLGDTDRNTLQKMIANADRNVRREAIRALGETKNLRPDEVFRLLRELQKETDPEVR